MLFNKKFIPSVFLGISLFFSTISPAHAEAESFSWVSMQRFLKRCVVIPTNAQDPNSSESGNLVSVCPDRLKVRGATAWFVLNGSEYQAVLTDSAYSDGGDLSDVIVHTMSGHEVARRENVLAYGDILLALAGGGDNFPRIAVDPELLKPEFREDLEAAILSQLARR